MVQIWKDFSLSWWNALASAWFQASAVLKIWHCGSHFALVYGAIVHGKYFWSFDHGIVILSVFMAPDRDVLLASRMSLDVNDMLSRGGRPLACHFAKVIVEMAKFVRLVSKTMFYLPVDPDRVICNHRDSNDVSSCHLTVRWARVDFADSTSADDFDFQITYIPPLLTKYGVDNEDKYFSRNR